MTRPHLPSLDGVRGLAILPVVLKHFADFSGVGEMHDRDLALEAYYRVVRWGGCGVTLFFVLSGYLITGILLDAKGGAGALTNFYIRRVLRIFPLYYAVLALYFGVLPMLGHSPPDMGIQAWYWSYLSNLWIAMHRWPPGKLAHTWSLAVEEQFYLVWPLVVLFTPRPTLVRVCGAMVVAAIGLRVYIAVASFSELGAVATPCQLDALAAGALLAAASRSPFTSWRSVYVGGIVAALAWLACTGLHGWRGLLLEPEGALASTLPRTLSVGVFAGLVGYAGRGERRPLLELPALRTLGKYSYGLYLLHFPIGATMRELHLLWPSRLPLVAGSRLPAVLGTTLLALLVSYAAAFVSWHVMEKRFLLLKDRFAYGPAEESPQRGANPLPAGSKGNRA